MRYTRFYSSEIMSALKYLHGAGVVHRDLKPENILMAEKVHIMLTDFGSARILPAPPTNVSEMYLTGGAMFNREFWEAF